MSKPMRVQNPTSSPQVESKPWLFRATKIRLHDTQKRQSRRRATEIRSRLGAGDSEDSRPTNDPEVCPAVTLRKPKTIPKIRRRVLAAGCFSSRLLRPAAEFTGLRKRAFIRSFSFKALPPWVRLAGPVRAGSVAELASLRPNSGACAAERDPGRRRGGAARGGL